MTDVVLPLGWQDPPADYSLAPFWFWNDTLDEQELLRQMWVFQHHGVDAFVIHPRVGLPRDTGWMSERLLARMRVVIETAAARGMWVMLYDEGMYPSGSASGQVVAEDPAYQCRGYVRIDLDSLQPNTTVQGVAVDGQGKLALSDRQTLIAEVAYQGRRYAIVQRPVQAVIRGLHFADHNATKPDPLEDEPLAIDLLNPDAVACFIRLSYDRYHAKFGPYFGRTVRAIFTDEPHLLGRLQEDGIVPGSTDSLEYVNAVLGYDFTPYLPALWDDDAPPQIRADYERALEQRFEQTYYARLYTWCDDHNIYLTGHPAEPDATRHLRYFHIPGQDIVWRFIEPDTPSALEGRQSTQAKAASSMMLHTGRRRNANEYCGAYGHSLTFDEMRWLTNWLLVRGCNLLIPHAFYYSVRGARYHERPPDVGLHSPWWGDAFTAFAGAARRLCWLNTDSDLVCQVAILGEHHHLPWRAAKACFENQIDFNYLDIDDLARSQVNDGQLHLSGQSYRALVVDSPLPESTQQQLDALAVPVITWTDDATNGLAQLHDHIPPTPFTSVVAPGLRVRHVRKAGHDWYIVFNETAEPISCALALPDTTTICDPEANTVETFPGKLVLAGHTVRVLVVPDP